MHVVHAMGPIVTYVARSVVCVSVCWSYWFTVQKRLKRSRCRLGLTHVGQRNRIFDESRSPWEGTEHADYCAHFQSNSNWTLKYDPNPYTNPNPNPIYPTDPTELY